MSKRKQPTGEDDDDNVELGPLRRTYLTTKTKADEHHGVHRDNNIPKEVAPKDLPWESANLIFRPKAKGGRKSKSIRKSKSRKRKRRYAIK